MSGNKPNLILLLFAVALLATAVALLVFTGGTDTHQQPAMSGSSETAMSEIVRLEDDQPVPLGAAPGDTANPFWISVMCAVGMLLVLVVVFKTAGTLSLRARFYSAARKKR
ncbi:hypothetical protein FACS1894171_1450 [Clostridia bacterium]|nr:hypothetical protein FACS1894171_1450 [Clostridia bacterium]